MAKSDAEIRARRQLKRNFVAMAERCAQAGPRAITGQGKLNETETGNVTVEAGTFYNNLTQVQIRTLRTAKGCNRTPPNVQQPGYLTLSDFLKIPTLDVQGAGCMAAFVHDLVLWAREVLRLNPHTFTAQDRGNFDTAIQNAIQTGVTSIEDYKANPSKFGAPADADQALYWYLMALGQVLSNEPIEKMDAWEKNKAAIIRKWKAAASDAGIPREFQSHPTIAALTDPSRFKRAVGLVIENYGKVFLFDV